MGLLEKDDDRKPLFRAFVKAKKKEGVDVSAIASVIKNIRFSNSEEWLILECQECIAMINAESKAGIAFWEFVQSLEGKLKALVVIPAKGKLGFDVIPAENLTGTWVQEKNEESVSFFLEGEEAGSNGTFTQLTIEAMQPSSQSSVQVKNKSKGNGQQS